MMPKSGWKKIKPEPCARPSGGNENAPKVFVIIVKIPFRKRIDHGPYRPHFKGGKKHQRKCGALLQGV